MEAKLIPNIVLQHRKRSPIRPKCDQNKVITSSRVFSKVDILIPSDNPKTLKTSMTTSDKRKRMKHRQYNTEKAKYTEKTLNKVERLSPSLFQGERACIRDSENKS